MNTTIPLSEDLRNYMIDMIEDIGGPVFDYYLYLDAIKENNLMLILPYITRLDNGDNRGTNIVGLVLTQLQSLDLPIPVQVPTYIQKTYIRRPKPK